jgi:hypothetical protein
MTEPEQLKKNALEGSRLPVRRELYEDQEILDSVPVARLGKDVIIQNSRPRPVSPVYSDISLEMAEKFSASLSGEMSPQKTPSRPSRRRWRASSNRERRPRAKRFAQLTAIVKVSFRLPPARRRHRRVSSYHVGRWFSAFLLTADR